MWHIENPELRPAKLDFKSSGQSWCDVTQLFADGVQIINAVELVSWDEDDTQFLICEQCGYFHCKRGDWVRVRRSDSQLFILPSFDHVFPDDEWESAEYAPPKYLRQRGVACIDRSTYENLRSQNSSFPPFEQFPELDAREAEVMSNWDATAATNR